MKASHLVIELSILCLAISAGVEAQATPARIPRWAAIVHDLSLKVRNTGPAGGAAGVFPPIIPKTLRNSDPSGTTETVNTGAPIDTRRNPFFQSLGTNGRACVTCHEPRSAWGVSAASIRQRFSASNGTDPIFRPVDGATCYTDDVSTVAARRKAYQLLLSQGLIRIFLPLPDTQLGSDPPVPRDYEIVDVDDPYGCTDLSSTPAIVSVYRRPLLSANLRFLTECPQGDAACTPLAIMWDGREPSLESQAIDATLGHAQALNPPAGSQVAQIVKFESQIYDAQVYDNSAGSLDHNGAGGGPVFLSEQEFFIGINDSLSPGFDPLVFTAYDAWQNLTDENQKDAARAAIARGQAIFNTRAFTIAGVSGLNRFPTDPLGSTAITGTCTTCHDTPNVGHHSEKLALDIGVADADPPALNVSKLPVFTVECTAGPLQGQVFKVTDLGRALITGKCADVGKIKGPMLRGLVARAPYFHNGSARTLGDVVEFYNQRFAIGFTEQEKADLIAFLRAL